MKSLVNVLHYDPPMILYTAKRGLCTEGHLESWLHVTRHALSPVAPGLVSIMSSVTLS